jgi:ankyrin repeat protein
MLLSKNAKSLESRPDGWRPIHTAAVNGHYKIIKLLVEDDREQVGMMDHDGLTPLILAAAGKEPVRLEIIKYLHANGGEIV